MELYSESNHDWKYHRAVYIKQLDIFIAIIIETRRDPRMARLGKRGACVVVAVSVVGDVVESVFFVRTACDFSNMYLGGPSKKSCESQN